MTPIVRVARHLVEKSKPDEAVGLLCSFAVRREKAEAHELLAEALSIDPSSRLAQQAFERMENVASAPQPELDAALLKFTDDALRAYEAEISRPSFRKAQLGFNNNVKYRMLVFHIQTEDSGLDKPHIITHLFADGGRVIKSHKRTYAEKVAEPDVGTYVKGLMKAQHMEMAICLREGRFDLVIDGKAVGGMELLTDAPRTEVQKLATKKESKASAGATPPAGPSADAIPLGTPVATPLAAPPAPAAPVAAPVAAAVAAPVAPGKVLFRLSVTRSLTGGPQEYAVRTQEAVLGRSGVVTLEGERFCHPREAVLRHVDGRVWLEDCDLGNGVFLKIKHPVELEVDDQFLVGDQLLSVERNPPRDDQPDPDPTFFYSSPKWPSAFRVVQVFEGGAKGACVLASGTTMQIGSVVGNFLFTTDPLVGDQHCIIEEQAGSIVLTDLGSRTGTFVRIKGEQELVSGDEILVGRTRMKLEVYA